jgi:hypothetical protein
MSKKNKEELIEIQDTFNTDSIEVLNEDCEVENIELLEVSNNGNEN